MISPVFMAWTFFNFLSGYVCCQQRRFFGAKKNSKHLDMYWFPPVFNWKHRRGVCVSVSLCCDFTSFCVELTTTIQNWDSLTQALVPASNLLVVTGMLTPTTCTCSSSPDDVIIKIVFHWALLAFDIVWLASCLVKGWLGMTGFFLFSVFFLVCFCTFVFSVLKAYFC